MRSASRCKPFDGQFLLQFNSDDLAESHWTTSATWRSFRFVAKIPMIIIPSSQWLAIHSAPPAHLCHNSISTTSKCQSSRRIIKIKWHRYELSQSSTCFFYLGHIHEELIIIILSWRNGTDSHTDTNAISEDHCLRFSKKIHNFSFRSPYFFQYPF